MSGARPDAVDPATWLDELEPAMAGHATILRRLVAKARKDPRLRALQVQGSIGRGTADTLSDLDVGLVVAEDQWAVVAAEMPRLVGGLGDVVDEHYHFLPSNQAPEVFKAWAHFRDGIQLDLLLIPTSRILGSGPDGRTLLDRDGILVRTDHPMRRSDAAAVADWAFLVWQNLTEVAKYAERGRPAGAAEWLNSARQATISCWAAAHELEYAGFANVAAAGLGVSAPWPVGLEDAYPRPEVPSVLAAALALAGVQEQADALLLQRFGIRPRPVARWVRTKLEELSRAGRPTLDTRPARRSRPRR